MLKRYRSLIITIAVFTAPTGIAQIAHADIAPDPGQQYIPHPPVPQSSDFWSTFGSNLTSSLPYFAILFSINLAVECLVAWIISVLWKSLKVKPLRLVGSVALANVISYPLLFLGLSMVNAAFRGDTFFYLGATVFGEIIVFILEALIIWLINKKTISFGRAAIISLIINGSTVLLGILFLVAMAIFSSLAIY